MGVLVLAIGDLHVPDLADGLPPAFAALLAPGRVHRALFAGNAASEAALDALRAACPDLTGAQGELDAPGRWPDSAVVAAGGLRLGVVGGGRLVPADSPDAMSALARRLDVDVLIAGGARDFSAARDGDGRLLLRPGSATGADARGAERAVGAPPPTPSFALLDVGAGRATIYVYRLAGGEVGVERLEYERAAAPAAAAEKAATGDTVAATPVEA
jgi:putative phosphoesterase